MELCDKSLLSVGFHVTLLEIGGKAMEILIVWKKGVGFASKEVSVPDSEQGQDNRNLKRQGKR